VTARAHAVNAALRVFRSEYLVALLCVAWLACALPFTPELLSPANLGNILASLLPLLILATGQTLVLVAGGIDLSVTSIVGLASVTGAFVMNGSSGFLAGSALATPAALLAMVALGGAVGLLNGTAVSLARMPPFMVTLTSMMFVSGLAVLLTQSRAIGNLPASFTRIGGDIAIAAVVTLGVVAGGHALLSRTLLGRRLQAVGHNPRAAVVSGIPVQRVLITVYVLSGIFAALASVLYTGRLETGSPVHGQRVLLDVIGATVIGGTSLYGGKGKVVWTLFGALFLTLIDNSLNLLNLSSFAIMMVKGGVILLAAWIDAVRNRGRAA
jgi:ribose/xylose/arabinose/galactoside ABC-type transport system permease subunit